VGIISSFKLLLSFQNTFQIQAFLLFASVYIAINATETLQKIIYLITTLFLGKLSIN